MNIQLAYVFLATIKPFSLYVSK